MTTSITNFTPYQPKFAASSRARRIAATLGLSTLVTLAGCSSTTNDSNDRFSRSTDPSCYVVGENKFNHHFVKIDDTFKGEVVEGYADFMNATNFDIDYTDDEQFLLTQYNNQGDWARSRQIEDEALQRTINDILTNKSADYRVDFSGMQVISVTENECKIQRGINFQNATLINADFSNMIVHGEASFDNAQLPNANFQGAKLPNANFHNATLTGATYNDQTVFPVGFDPEAHGMIKV